MSDFPLLHIHHDFGPTLRIIPKWSSNQRRYDCTPAHDLRFPENIIFEAVEQNDKDNLMQVLEENKGNFLPLSLGTDEDLSIFHLAASQPQFKECLEILCSFAGNNLPMFRECISNTGYTALHVACIYGCEENALILMQNGWDPMKKTGMCYTALHFAAHSGCIKVIHHILNLQVENEAILSVDAYGDLPLHTACRYANMETACLLLECNPATINFKNFDGITPFMYATRFFDTHDVQFLLQKGARADISTNYGDSALYYACFDGIDKFSLLIQSTSAKFLQQCWVSNALRVLQTKELSSISESYACLALLRGPEHLTVLINSNFPKNLIKMPFIQCHCFGMQVLSPLAYLFFYFIEHKTIQFDECLNLLIQHKIIMVDEFPSILKTSWPESDVQFVNPLSILLSCKWPNNNREYYFNLLIANNVTTDYCLQCYHDNDKPFATFYKYQMHYCLVIYAIERLDVEIVKLLVANSVILEPDILCNFLIMAYTKRESISSKDMEEACRMYQYLINLKPIYYKWHQQCRARSQTCPFMPAAEILSDNAFEKFCEQPYTYQRCPILKTHYYVRSLTNYNFQPFPYILATDEFANVKLQQLCRTAIRQQLREPTLEGNLRNFRRKVQELPLPDSLKDYLLFKN